MRILDLIMKSAVILNVDQILKDDSVINYKGNSDTVLDGNKELKRMYELSKIVVNEVSSYVPLKGESKIQSKNKSISLYSFVDLIRIVDVKNKFGHVHFKLTDSCIYVDEDGEYTVTYYAYPSIDYLDDPVPVKGCASEDLFVAGLNSYYCLATGLYAEYNVYNSQYVDKLSRINNLKLFSMPCRSWND